MIAREGGQGSYLLQGIKNSPRLLLPQHGLHMVSVIAPVVAARCPASAGGGDAAMVPLLSWLLLHTPRYAPVITRAL